MSEAPQARSLTELAEAAAAAGDFASAVRHLQDLAAVQEAELGPSHPDLANTLNNLGVASERAGELDRAEAAFRRASLIARTAFEADHPFVATAGRNLREFCQANDRPYEKATLQASAVAEPSPAPRAIAGRSWSTLVLAGTVAGLAAAAVLMWLTAGRREIAPATAATPAESRSKPEQKLEPRPEPKSPSQSERPAVVPAPVAGETSSPLSLVSATVCREFSTAGGGEWSCTPVAGSAPAGLLVFYTRVKSAEPTTLEHRWYRGDAVHQRVSLRVAANTGAGYRTFSRNTVGSDRTGTWRVELRDVAGAVLYEQTFVVQ